MSQPTDNSNVWHGGKHRDYLAAAARADAAAEAWEVFVREQLAKQGGVR